MNKVVFCIGVAIMCSSLHAATKTQIGRYATVENKPTVAQIDPLKSIIQMTFPSSVETIGQAIEAWMKSSGYRLIGTEKQSDELQLILLQPLPQADRHLGPLTIEDGLTVLVGQEQFTLDKNPIRREVNFTLIKREAEDDEC